MKSYTITHKDSITRLNIKRDSTVQKWIINRNEDSQIEWKNGVGNGKAEYAIIEWIDDCTYRLIFDDSKMELDDGKKWLNENNGIVVSKIKIEGKCMFYNATMTTNDGRKILQNGTICKE